MFSVLRWTKDSQFEHEKENVEVINLIQTFQWQLIFKGSHSHQRNISLNAPKTVRRDSWSASVAKFKRNETIRATQKEIYTSNVKKYPVAKESAGFIRSDPKREYKRTVSVRLLFLSSATSGSFLRRLLSFRHSLFLLEHLTHLCSLLMRGVFARCLLLWHFIQSLNTFNTVRNSRRSFKGSWTERTNERWSALYSVKREVILSCNSSYSSTMIFLDNIATNTTKRNYYCDIKLKPENWKTKGIGYVHRLF